ncbi:serine hydroxymethyltransferase, partial [Saccharopolyspora sp. NFXS83]|nr:serine hydroxymethyltransferase [Saccharopolyspora sp. NFXS83]
MSPSSNASAVDVFNDQLSVVDPEVASAVGAELGRQQNTLEMIAS